MKATAVGILSLLILGICQSAQGQVVFSLIDTVALTNSCAGGTPLQDGHPVLVQWDRNANGPDAEDSTFMQFLSNGEEINGLPGTFATEPLIVLPGNFPQPWQFYVKVRACEFDVQWTSETIVVTQGLHDFFLSHWTCGPCVDFPGRVMGLTATQALCNEIRLTWNEATAAWVYFVYRDGVSLGLVPGTSYVDTAPPPGGNCYSYRVQAVNEAGAGPMSDAVEGCFIENEPIAITEFSASDNLCGQVLVRWSLAYDADEYIVRRDNTRIATVAHPVNEYSDVVSNDAVHQYSIIAVNDCGESSVLAPTPGRALLEVSAITGFDVSTSFDDRVSVSWSNVLHESGYELWRSVAGHVREYELVATTGRDTTEFEDFSAVPGQEYFYRVRGFNDACEPGGFSLETRGLRTVSEPVRFGEILVADNLNGVMSAAARDLDQDGDIDVAAAGMFANKVCWYENNGDWGYTEHVLISNWRGARAVDIGDIDGDGDLDIAAVAKFENALVWFEQGPFGVFTTHAISGEVMGASDVTIVNTNLNDTLEIMTAAAEGGDISLWHIQGDHFTRQAFATNLPGARSLSSLSITIPNNLWIFGAAQETGELATWGRMHNYSKQTLGFFPGITACGAAQLNTEIDSLHDVYFCVPDDHYLGWVDWTADEQHDISTLVESPRGVAAADVDGDRRDDILLAANSEISWWRNTRGRFYRNVITEDLEQATFVRGIDFDHDGDIDILAAGGSEVRLYLSTRTDDQFNSSLAKPVEDTPQETFGMVTEFALSENYPNPFNPSTTIEFSLSESTNARLAVFDVTGREVSRLVDGETGAGRHAVVFNGAGLASGVYFYRLSAGARVETRKMVLLK